MHSLEISSGPREDIVTEAKLHYHETAKLIEASQNEDEKLRFQMHISEIASSAPSSLFYFICGPSWGGKTQFIYLLDRYSLHPMKKRDLNDDVVSEPLFDCVLHFVVDDAIHDLFVEDIQPIYQYQGPSSSALLNAIEEDTERITSVLVSKIRDLKWSKPLRAIMKAIDCSEEKIKNLKNDELSRFLDRKLTENHRLSRAFILNYSEIYSWKSLGVLKSLIAHRRNLGSDDITEEIDVIPVSLRDFNKFVEFGKPVLVCLDEFHLSKSPENMFKLTFLRNLLRHACVVPLLLGTNASVSNLTHSISTNASHSRGGEQVWCKILTKLPVLASESLSLAPCRDQLPSNVVDLIMKSPLRPGITEVFMSQLGRSGIQDSFALAGNIKQAAEFTFQLMLRRKNRLGDYVNILGYFAMMFSKFHTRFEKYSWPTFLINRHLAHMIPSPEIHKDQLPYFIKVTKENDCLYIASHNVVLNPASIYVDVDADELTQFIVMTGMRSMNDQNLGKFVNLPKALGKSVIFRSNPSKWNALKVAEKVGNLNIFSLSFRFVVEFVWNSQLMYSKHSAGKDKRDGEKMECLAKGATVKASVSGGPSGQPFEKFLLRYAEELQLIKAKPLQWTFNALALLGPVKDQIVPFVMAVGHRASKEFRSIPGFYFGVLEELKDSARLDGLLTPDYTVEADEQYSKDSLRQVYLTMEQKDRDPDGRFDGSDLDATIERAAHDGRMYHGRWKERHDHAPKHHVHLLTVSSVTKFTNLSRMHEKYGHLVELYLMTFDSSEHTLDLRNLFDQSGQSVERDRSTISAFPRTKIIIVPIEDLFQYSFESAIDKICVNTD